MRVLKVIVALVCAALLGAAGQLRADDDADLAAIGKRAVSPKCKTAKPMFAKRATAVSFQIDEKWVYAVPLQRSRESRTSVNFDAKWKGERKFKVYLVNIDRVQRSACAFQRKGDKKWRPDSNRGKVFRHDSTVTLDGKNNYLAIRGLATKDLKQKDPFVLFVEVGLSVEKVRQYLEKN